MARWMDAQNSQGKTEYCFMAQIQYTKHITLSTIPPTKTKPV